VAVTFDTVKSGSIPGIDGGYIALPIYTENVSRQMLNSTKARFFELQFLKVLLNIISGEYKDETKGEADVTNFGLSGSSSPSQSTRNGSTSAVLVLSLKQIFFFLDLLDSHLILGSFQYRDWELVQPLVKVDRPHQLARSVLQR
jgi:hypothetical protein